MDHRKHTSRFDVALECIHNDSAIPPKIRVFFHLGTTYLAILWIIEEFQTEGNESFKTLTRFMKYVKAFSPGQRMNKF